MKDVKVEYVNLDDKEEMDKFDKLIEKHEQREKEMQKAYDDYIASQEKIDEWEEKIYPKKQITVKLFPNTHKKLKVMATSKDTTLEKIATSIVEDKIGSMDIVKYVTDEFDLAEEYASYRIGVDYSIAQYGSDLMEDHNKADYDRYATVLKIGKPRKRVNVKVYSDTHMKLKIMAAIQDRSLNNIVSSIIEDEIGEPNEIDFTELNNAIIKYENINVEDIDIEQIKEKFNLD